jgi:hypothetical protein
VTLFFDDYVLVAGRRSKFKKSARRCLLMSAVGTGLDVMVVFVYIASVRVVFRGYCKVATARCLSLATMVCFPCEVRSYVT